MPFGFRAQVRSAVARMERSEIRVRSLVEIVVPDCAEPVIGRAFARPVGSIRATRHAPLSFRLEQRVKMRMPLVHA
jgi:hypothetical protein